MALCQGFWDAGVPKEAFQVIITERDALNKLTQAPEVKHIILTGGTDTAQSILRAKPTTSLSAETGGKDVIIVTASADMDRYHVCLSFRFRQCRTEVLVVLVVVGGGALCLRSP